MHTFSDDKNRTWEIAVHYGSLKRVKGLIGESIADLMAGLQPGIVRINTDIEWLCDVIYAFIQPQADEAGVSDEEWAASMGGDAILGARKAFVEELRDFYRKLGRTDVVAALEKQTAFVDAAIAASEAKIEQMDPSEVDEAFSKLDMSLPDFSESTRTPSPSES